MKHKLTLTTLATILFIMSGQMAHAQKNKNLSLEEAVQLSIEHSGQIKLANYKVDEATANYKEVWNNHLPDVKISGSYLRINSPNVDLKVKLGGNSTDTTKKASNPKVEQLGYGMVNATLPIFSGFRIKYGAESAKYLELAAKLDAQNDKEEVIQNTINAYSNVYKAKRSVELIEENLKQQKQRVTDFTNLEKNGLLARNDLLKAQLQQSNIELTLLDAQNNLKMAYINMDLMLGFPEETELTPDTSGLAYPPDGGSVLQWEQTAHQNRKDIASLGMREKAAISGIKSTKGEMYPGLALTGGYIAADIPNFLTITNALNIGIGLQYNLGSLWKTQAKIDQQKARLHQVQATQGLLSDLIRIQINKAYQDYILSLQKIEVYARAIDQASENYRITKNKFDNSLATTTELLEADVAQLQAKLNYMFSKIDALVAYKKLQQTAGTLSENK